MCRMYPSFCIDYLPKGLSCLHIHLIKRTIHLHLLSNKITKLQNLIPQGYINETSETLAHAES